MTAGTTTIHIQTLLDRLQAGPQDAATRKELIGLAYDRLAVVARRLLGPAYRDRPEDTSGLLAEVYARLEASLADVRPESVRQFLGLAALQMRRGLVDLIRKQRGRDLDRPGVGGLTGVDPPAGATTDADWRLDLMDAVGRLEEGEREVVDLLFFHGLTQDEAADLLGVDESTVKRRWARARVRLASWLKAFDPGPAAV
jgi:RNA polymerase sigma factor (sigma-70 family)